MDCGSVVYSECEGKTIPVSEQGIQDYANEIVSVGTFIIKIALATGAQSMSYNMIRGLNALRCAFVSGFYNIWLLVASGYYACAEFGCVDQYLEYIQMSVPYVCTCEIETDKWATQFGASLDQVHQFDSCGAGSSTTN